MWHAYPSAPLDRPRELASLIAVCSPFEAAVRRSVRAGRPLRVRRWFVAETAMGEAARPWPVPPLPTVGDLAEVLELSVGELAWLADVRSLERDAEPEALRNYRYAGCPAV